MREYFRNIYFTIIKKLYSVPLIYNTIINKTLIKQGNLKVGKYSYGINNIKIRSFRGNNVDITIGNFVSISSNCEIITGGIHPIDKISTFPLTERFLKKPFYTDRMPYSNGPIIIGSDVWIASNVTILSGVKIGEGAVIATGSIVTRDIPSYAIAGGVPAQVIKFRFNEKHIEELLKIKWWDWSDDKIEKEIDIIVSSTVEKFTNLFKVQDETI